MTDLCGFAKVGLEGITPLRFRSDRGLRRAKARGSARRVAARVSVPPLTENVKGWGTPSIPKPARLESGETLRHEQPQRRVQELALIPLTDRRKSI